MHVYVDQLYFCKGLTSAICDIVWWTFYCSVRNCQLQCCLKWPGVLG